MILNTRIKGLTSIEPGSKWIGVLKIDSVFSKSTLEEEIRSPIYPQFKVKLLANLMMH